MIQLPIDFKEFLRLLNAKRVEYMVVGGYAVSFHGYPRNTGDIDVWIATNADNLQKVIDALGDFGLTDPELNADVFSDPTRILRVGVPPLRIEIMTDLSGVSFARCCVNRVFAEVDGITVPFIGPDDLRENKQAAGRQKDMIDLEHLP